MTTLSEELAYFRAQLPEWLRHHADKYALVKGERLLGTFDTFEAAYDAGVAQLGNVPMLIRRVTPEEPTASLPALLHGILRAHP